MEIFHTSKELRHRLSEIESRSQIIGFVPTMGSLHSGHATLIKAAKTKSDVVVLSIYVNPTQFNNQDDFKAYPKAKQSDLDLARSLNVDVVFVPDTEEVYGGVPNAEPIHYGALTSAFEGSRRKGHFDGVVAIVRKLFLIVSPKKAFFGEKDLQQLAVIQELCRREFSDLEIVPCPLIRDVDGLALSSRNVRLTSKDRLVALELNRTLNRLKAAVNKSKGGGIDLDSERIALDGNDDLELEYLAIIDAESFEEVGESKFNEGHAVIAAQVGSVRLIDNLFMG
jgi:pantoate--beta-alanine ligase